MTYTSVSPSLEIGLMIRTIPLSGVEGIAVILYVGTVPTQSNEHPLSDETRSKGLWTPSSITQHPLPSSPGAAGGCTVPRSPMGQLVDFQALCDQKPCACPQGLSIWRGQQLETHHGVPPLIPTASLPSGIHLNACKMVFFPSPSTSWSCRGPGALGNSTLSPCLWEL